MIWFVAAVVFIAELFFLLYLVNGYRTVRRLRVDAITYYKDAEQREREATDAYNSARAFAEDLRAQYDAAQ